MVVGGPRHTAADFPRAKTRYPLCRRLGGHQGRSGRVWKILPPPGFDPRTVQPVASRYNYWATRPTNEAYSKAKKKGKVIPLQALCGPEGG